MNQLIKKELKSNFLRFKKEEYSYKNTFLDAYGEKLPLFVSLFFMNLVLLILSIGTDCLTLILAIPYWWTLLIRVPVVTYAILSFQIWKNRIAFPFELSFLVLSIFVPIWSIFLFMYLVFRTYIETSIY